MPPFGLVDGEALGFHSPAQQVPMPALPRRAAGVVGVRTIGHLVVAADHRNGLAGLAMVEGEIDGAASIVPRTLGWVGDENVQLLRRRVPEHLRDVTRPITVMDQ